MMRLNKEGKSFTDRQKRFIGLIIILLILIFSAAVAWFIGKPMIRLVSSRGDFREWVETHGIYGRFIFVGMVIFQVVIAAVPGEPLEIGAGFAFGAIEGTLLCMVGITLGSAAVFLLVRKFGIHLVELFFDIEKIRKLKFLQNEKRLTLITLIVFLLPGTPKDLLTYAVGLTDMRFSAFLLIASFARLPSIVTSTVGGSALGVENYVLAVAVFAGTAVLSAAGLCIYKHINNKKS